MTNILYWNIENFSNNKFFSASNKVRPGQAGLSDANACGARKLYFNALLQMSQADIIVIVEVSCGRRGNGKLATNTLGRQGAYSLLASIRTQTGDGADANGDEIYGWRLVPPLQVGENAIAESVAIYYRGVIRDLNDNLIGRRYFTGPNWWRGGGGEDGVSDEAGAVNENPAAYPNAVSNGLLSGVAARNVPNSALHNTGRLESRLAARTKFREDNNGVAGDLLDFDVFRPPYLATFTEVDAQGAATKHLSVFGVHTPPNTDRADAFIAYLSQAHDVVAGFQQHESRVICGDFNLNLLDPAGQDAQAYQALTNNGYTVLLDPAQANPPAGVAAYRGYFATHILPAKNAVLWSTNTETPPYPSYKYIGSKFVKNLFSIDNILVRPAPAAPTRFTIANVITGTPLNLINNPPGNPPLGTLGFFNLMRSLPNNQNWPINPAPQGPGMPVRLRGWNNYGRIRSTSDHLALFARV